MASSVPQANVGGAVMNASALCAKFMVDIRIFEWTPQSVEEYLNAGRVPHGLPLDGQASVSALALGFDHITNQYDHKSQIYNSAIWTKQLSSDFIFPATFSTLFAKFCTTNSALQHIFFVCKVVEIVGVP